MSAGLPGLGLGGLFFILSALLAPVGELVRTARGQSSRGAWAEVGRQFALAVAMIVAVDLTIRLAYALLDITELGDAPSAGSMTVLPLLPIGITAALLATVLLTAKGMQLASRLPSGPPAMPRVWPSRPRLLAGTGALVAAWFALLFLGASQLSTLSGEADGGGLDAPAEEVVAGDGQKAPGNPAGVPGSGSVSPTADLESPSDLGPARPHQGPVAAGVEVDLASGVQTGGGAAEGQPSPGGQAPATQPGQAHVGEEGSPDAAGPPDDAGPPAQSQAPEGSGPPDRAGPPETFGRPAWPGGRQPSER